MKYRLTQRRLIRKLDEANVLIERLLNKGITPDITLHPVPKKDFFARMVGCHRFRESR